MLEQIIYDIVKAVVNGDEVDSDALYYHLGDANMTNEIIAGIKRGLTIDPFDALKDY